MIVGSFHNASIAPALLVAAGVAGCAPPPELVENPDLVPLHQGADVLDLGDDLLNVQVTVQDARRAEDVTDYARCVMADYAKEHGFRYARHLRTNLDADRKRRWLGDAIYMVSRERPDGLEIIDTAAVVKDCKEKGIPLV